MQNPAAGFDPLLEHRMSAILEKRHSRELSH
jgi:hypothetical protein